MVQDKTIEFAALIFELTRRLQKEENEYIISNQIMRSASSIGANIAEAKYAESDSDYIHKYKISLKEASETEFWLRLMSRVQLINVQQENKLISLVHELLKIMTSIVNKVRNKKR